MPIRPEWFDPSDYACPLARRVRALRGPERLSISFSMFSAAQLLGSFSFLLGELRGETLARRASSSFELAPGQADAASR